jgi:hypothetical protein
MPHFGTYNYYTVTILASGESCHQFLNSSNRLYVSAIGTYIAGNSPNPDAGIDLAGFNII